MILMGWWVYPPYPEVRVLLTESRRIETTKVDFPKSDPTGKQGLENLPPDLQPSRLIIHPEDYEEVVSVIVHNTGTVPIKDAIASIASNVPIKGLSNGKIDETMSFSPYQVNYHILRIDPYA